MQVGSKWQQAGTAGRQAGRQASRQCDVLAQISAGPPQGKCSLTETHATAPALPYSADRARLTVFVSDKPESEGVNRKDRQED
jgi:hypothetical protein